jgi:hypothetical protein
MRLIAVMVFLALSTVPCIPAMEFQTPMMHHLISIDVDSQYNLTEEPFYFSELEKWITQYELHGDGNKNAIVAITEFEDNQSHCTLDSIKLEKERQINSLGVGGSTFLNTTINGKPALTWHIPRQTVTKGYTFEEIYGYGYWYNNRTEVSATVFGLGKTVYDDLLKMKITSAANASGS